MKKCFCTLALICFASLLATAQVPRPRDRPQSRQPPSADPAAIIHTTAGDLHCTLFPKVPIGVANFIGLAKGTKDWTSPISHAKKHGVPSL